MTEAVSIDMSSVMNAKQKFNQRLISVINKKLDTLKVSYTPKDVDKIVSLLNEGKTKAQLTEEVTALFAEDKNKINSSFINYLIGYSNVSINTPVQEPEPVEDLKSPSIKSDRASIKAENISKTKRRVSQISQSSRNRRSILDGAPLSPPPSPPKSSRASSVCSSDYEKSQKNIYHQRRLSRSANTLDLTSQVQSEIMAQTLAIQLKEKDVKKDRRRSSIRSHRSSFSSVKEEDTSRIRCQYWPNCNLVINVSTGIQRNYVRSSQIVQMVIIAYIYIQLLLLHLNHNLSHLSIEEFHNQAILHQIFQVNVVLLNVNTVLTVLV